MTTGLHLADLITAFNDEADNFASPPLWSQSTLIQYANEAQIEAARRARLLKDSSTAAICTYVLGSGVQNIGLDNRIIYVKRCHIASNNLPLVKKHKADLDAMWPGWDYPTPTTAGSSIITYCTDHDTGQIWFNAPSPAADTVYLQVVRIPLNDMVLQSTSTTTGTATVTASVDPEINPRYQLKLIHWMLYRAYSKQDSETNDPDKAKNALAEFEREFGPPVSAQNEMYTEEEYGYDSYDGSY
jgi:hypothetical protein